ncbi:MAG: hypothetical protein GF346_09795 [Candidatus Eisenbacteria bacterium]|nr:hypothetical protein [Candidatus Latescibacterota bacterium]MBD3302726.1 hypothetical protein [Candidatus Eisenbacteria bacterium]
MRAVVGFHHATHPGLLPRARRALRQPDPIRVQSHDQGRFALVSPGIVLLLSLLLPAVALAWTPASHPVIENRGQIDGPAAFYALGDGAALYFTEDAVVFDFTEKGHAVWMHLDGRSQGAELAARGSSQANLNFFLGNDPTGWKSGIKMYEEVVYRDAWPGVDLRFHPEPGQLRYEIVAQPGADRAQARLRFEGMNRIRETADGGVWLEASSIVLSDVSMPSGGTTGSETEMRCIRWGAGSEQVRNDPSDLIWCTLLGGSNYDRSHGLVLDSDGNPFVTGYTKSADFPVSPGTYDPTHNGEYDAYVTKLSADGSKMLWSTFLGGSGWDRGFAVHLDSAGNPTFSGLTESSDLPTTDGAHDRTLGGSMDGFVSKLDPTGGVLIYSTYVGGSGRDRPFHMILDAEDRPIVVGETTSSDYPTTEGAYDESYNGGTDGCVTKLDALGSSVVWSTYIGGSVYEQISWVDLGADQGPIMCGSTRSDDYPTTTGAFDVTYNGGRDCMITKLDSEGETLVYSTFLGCALDDYGNAIAVSASGEAVVTGSTECAEFPTTPGAYDTVYHGAKDVFVARLSFTGEELLWSTLLGGSQDEEPFAFCLGAGDIPIVAGSVSSSEYPTTSDAYDDSYNGARDAFLSRLNVDGSDLLWSSFIGGEYRDDAFEVVMHPSGEPVVAGQTYGGTFPTTEGAYDRSHAGLTDVYLARFDVRGAAGLQDGSSGSPVTRLSMSAGPNPFSESVRVRFDMPRAGKAELSVLDVGGRRIALVDRGFRTTGMQQIWWDGRTSSGRRLSPGIYWLRLDVDGDHANQRLVRIR